MEKQVMANGILTDEQVKGLKKKVEFWGSFEENQLLIGSAVVISGSFISILMAKITSVAIILGLGALVVGFGLNLWIVELLGKKEKQYRTRLKIHNVAKDVQVSEYLEEHPELIEVAEQQFIKKQAHDKAFYAVRNLISTNGKIDEPALLEALQK